MLINVYAQKKNNGDVVITRENGNHFATIKCWNSARPDRRNKYITLNCYRWRLIWKEPAQ